MFRLSFTVANQVQFDRAFNRVGEHVKDFREVWPFVRDEFWRIEREQFKSEGAKGRSGKWKPLTRAYAKQKAKTHPGQPILRRTGKLEKSLTGQTGDTILTMKPQEFAIGSNLKYGLFHQTGTGKMPAREPISLGEDTRTRLMKEIQKGLLRVIRKDRTVTQSLDVEG